MVPSSCWFSWSYQVPKRLLTCWEEQVKNLDYKIFRGQTGGGHDDEETINGPALVWILIVVIILSLPPDEAHFRW